MHVDATMAVPLVGLVNVIAEASIHNAPPNAIHLPSCILADREEARYQHSSGRLSELHDNAHECCMRAPRHSAVRASEPIASAAGA